VFKAVFPLSFFLVGIAAAEAAYTFAYQPEL